MEKYMTTKQAAALIKVHPKTLIRYAKDGDIPFTKPKGRYYFTKSNILAFLRNEL